MSAPLGVKYDDQKPRWVFMPWPTVHRALQQSSAVPMPEEAHDGLCVLYARAASKPEEASGWYLLAGHALRVHARLRSRSLWASLEGLEMVLIHGAAKYGVSPQPGAENWRIIMAGPCGPERFREACRRHLLAAAGDIPVDASSNQHHLLHAATNALFLAEGLGGPTG